MTTNTQLAPELIAEVGQFKYWRDGVGEDNIEGPETYLCDQGSRLLAQIAAGEDAVFNLTCAQSPTLEIAVLVRLQTDYAAWRGLQQFGATHGIE